MGSVQLQAQGELNRIASAGLSHGSPIVAEIESLRSRCSKTFLHADGKRTTIIHGKALHYRKGAGPWLDIPAEFAALTDYYGETADGAIQGDSNVYATARATSTSCGIIGTTPGIGQRYQYPTTPWYQILRSFLSFPTAAIPDDASVTAVTLYVCADADSSQTDFLVKVYRYSWAEPLCDSQEANYDNAYGGTLEGTLRDTADGWSSGTYYNLVLDPTGINKLGDTKYTLVSSRDVSGTAPTQDERVSWRSANYAGTSSDPYLSITWTLDATVSAVLASSSASGLMTALAYDYAFPVELAAATSSDLPCSVSLGTTVAQELAGAEALGLSSEILAGLWIACELAEATTEGLPASTIYDMIIAGALGAAQAKAQPGAIAIFQVIAGALATASADGFPTSLLYDLILGMSRADATAQSLAGFIMAYQAILGCSVSDAAAYALTLQQAGIYGLSLSDAAVSGISITKEP